MNKEVNPNAIMCLIAVLSLFGLGIAIYLTINYTQDTAPYCLESSGCEDVQTSKYASIIGGVTVPILGVFGYILLLALVLAHDRISAQVDLYLPLLLYATASIALLFSAYLTYLEAFVIEAWCYWCLASALVSTVIWALSVFNLRLTWFKS